MVSPQILPVTNILRQPPLLLSVDQHPAIWPSRLCRFEPHFSPCTSTLATMGSLRLRIRERESPCAVSRR